MAEKAVLPESNISPWDTFKISLAVIILAAGIVGFYYFASQLVVFRALGLLVVGGISLGIFASSKLGRWVWRFLMDSRTEVRKIVWPSRKETTQVTLVVLAMTVIVGISLWLLDMFLGWAIKVMMGYGG